MGISDKRDIAPHSGKTPQNCVATEPQLHDTLTLLAKRKSVILPEIVDKHLEIR